MASDRFIATSERGLAPVYEALLAAAVTQAAGNAAEEQAFLSAWAGLLDQVLGDFDRGNLSLKTSFSYIFSQVVGGYETALAAGVVPASSLAALAGALGVPEEMIISGQGVLEGTAGANIFYMGAGDQIARGGPGHDVYVFGRNFGQDVIDDDEPYGTNRAPDMVRFSAHRADEVIARREGKGSRISRLRQITHYRLHNIRDCA